MMTVFKLYRFVRKITFDITRRRYLCSYPQTKKVENVDITENICHIPVMLKEIISAFIPKKDQVFIDMTFGGGGHSRQLLSSADIKLYCMDRDPMAYDLAEQMAQEFKGIIPVLSRFSEMCTALTNSGLKPNSVDGILIDAGYSSIQMDTAERGFSINRNGLLDMRMDGNRYPDQPTAFDVLNSLDVPSLAKILKVYGEEKYAKKISQALYNARFMLKTINTTHELAEIIQSTLGCQHRMDKLQRPTHAATKVFQALRIFVNDELNELNYGIEMAHRYLKPGGKLCILTFHSLEDRIAKRHILGIDMDEPVSQSLRQKYKNAGMWHSQEDVNSVCAKKWQPLHKNVLTPTHEEVESNPRSRSAKLRVAEKLDVSSVERKH